ncbi:MAG: chromosomal replication initiator protein DnaA [Firmicutes bacterium]|nr:chromosomal replication initiator protein DnaA [Bacillota bacterium]
MTKTALKQNWESVIELLYSELDDVVVNTFFAPLVPAKISETEGKIFFISENSKFYQNTINHHQDLIVSATEKVFGKPYFAVVQESVEEEDIDDQQKEDYLNPKYTFDSFVPGPTNRMAYAASMAVADGFTKTYNPLFLYAGSGLGKTHLMHAIGHFVKRHKPKKKILYVSAETFVSELIEAIRTHKQNQFKEKYRKVDYLLFDDVQFIAGNKFAEEELYNTFETLRAANKQMVFTSDRPPRELGDIPERLVSRFVWGVMVDIQPPDYETRMAILKNKALLENVDISSQEVIEVFDLIAHSFKNNIRELEGAFTRVLAFSAFSGEPINISLAKKVLSDVIVKDKKELTPEKIKKAVAEYYGITVEDLDSSKRSRNISYPRHIAIYLIRNRLGISYPSIGKIFGGKDHTSIMHSCEVIENELKYSDELSAAIDAIMENVDI